MYQKDNPRSSSDFRRSSCLAEESRKIMLNPDKLKNQLDINEDRGLMVHRPPGSSPMAKFRPQKNIQCRISMTYLEDLGECLLSLSSYSTLSYFAYKYTQF